jgi:hypothetical protein
MSIQKRLSMMKACTNFHHLVGWFPPTSEFFSVQHERNEKKANNAAYHAANYGAYGRGFACTGVYRNTRSSLSGL